VKRRGQSALPERLSYSNKANRKPGPHHALRTWLQLTRGNQAVLPPEFRREDVRFSDSLVEFFLNEFTKTGDIVLDPFAGYGTTLLVAESMGRSGYGIEYSENKARYVQGLLDQPGHLIHGDARKLLEYDLPDFDLCLTSPPYTNKHDTENPFVDYRQKGFAYASYLQEFGQIFSQVSRKMKPSGHVVIEIANLKKKGEVTSLAWDVAGVVSQIMRFEGERVVCWDKYDYGYDHSYCLIFSKA
jgi:SAM-dependent methyltransferase